MKKRKRDRKFILYFQDQEAEYQGTVDFVEWAMSQPNVIPLWYQVPIYDKCSEPSAIVSFAWEKMRNG
jgi:predicted phosphoadenosine phosphosulfate sulfurtransferase